MPRLSIKNLPKPPKHYRPDLYSDALGINIKFESNERVLKEDHLRLRSLKWLLTRSYKLGPPLTEDLLKRLIRRIESAASPASSRYMRKQRIRIAGHLWKMVAARPELASAFTLIPRSWEFSGGFLDQADPNLLLAGC